MPEGFTSIQVCSDLPPEIDPGSTYRSSKLVFFMLILQQGNLPSLSWAFSSTLKAPSLSCSGAFSTILDAHQGPRCPVLLYPTGLIASYSSLTLRRRFSSRLGNTSWVHFEQFHLL